MDFGKEKITVLFGKIFFPTLAGMLSTCAVTAADGIFVGRGIGGDGIAAVNICVPLLMFFTGLSLMTGIGGSVIASIALSKGKIKRARFNVTQSMLFAAAIATAFVAVILMFPNETAAMLGASEHLRDMVVTYLVWFVPALVFLVCGIASMFYIRLDGAPKLAMWCNIIPAVLNAFLDWLFIFTFQWGVMGAAFASSLSVFAGGIIAVAYLQFFAKNVRFYPLKIGVRGFHLFFENIWSQCRIGSSALMGEATMAMLMFVGNQVFMRYLGDDGVAAFGALATGVFALFPASAVGLFLDPSEPAARLAAEGFPYFAAGFACFILNLTGIGYFQSVGRLAPATVFAVLRGVAFLLPAFYFMPVLAGTAGIWLAMPVSETATFLAMIAYFLIKKRY